MKLKDTGLTFQDIKDKVNKYMIETYERFDFLAETADGMYIYDENGTPYLDFYAGIAVNNAGNRNPKVVAAVKDQVDDPKERQYPIFVASEQRLNVRLTARIQPLLRGHKYALFIFRSSAC